MKRYEDAKNLVIATDKKLIAFATKDGLAEVVTWNNTYKLRVDEEFELM